MEISAVLHQFSAKTEFEVSYAVWYSWCACPHGVKSSDSLFHCVLYSVPVYYHRWALCLKLRIEATGIVIINCIIVSNLKHAAYDLVIF